MNHEQRPFDHGDQVLPNTLRSMHVGGSSHEPSEFELSHRHDTLRRIAAETCAPELVEALKAALANAEGWQWQAQRLLESIAAGEMKEPR